MRAGLAPARGGFAGRCLGSFGFRTRWRRSGESNSACWFWRPACYRNTSPTWISRRVGKEVPPCGVDLALGQEELGAGQFFDRWPPGAPQQGHTRPLWRPVGLAAIAAGTGGNQVFPSMLSTLRPRNDVIVGQPAGRKGSAALGTGALVAKDQQVMAAEGWDFWSGHEPSHSKDCRQQHAG